MTHELLERARAHGAPLIEGDSALFIWEGETAPQLIADFTNWENFPVALTETAPGIWTHRIDLPSDAYIEYAYGSDENRILDPLNRRLTPNGMGKFNHYFYMPKGRPTPLIRRRPSVPEGRITRHQLIAPFVTANGKRTVHLYQPPVSHPVPLVVVWDGKDYLQRARLPRIVDNLIAAGRMSPIALALVDNGGPARGVEYACSEMSLGLLLQYVIPLARQELNLLDPEEHPGSYGVMGASMGGLMALFTGISLPSIFGKVLSQSGAFHLRGMGSTLIKLIRLEEIKPLQIWMDVGRYEFLLEGNRKMKADLETKGYPFTYQEYNGGHNYPAWRNDLAAGLETLFPPK